MDNLAKLEAILSRLSPAQVDLALEFCEALNQATSEPTEDELRRQAELDLPRFLREGRGKRGVAD